MRPARLRVILGPDSSHRLVLYSGDSTITRSSPQFVVSTVSQSSWPELFPHFTYAVFTLQKDDTVFEALIREIEKHTVHLPGSKFVF